jgi:hypothetical protein
MDALRDTGGDVRDFKTARPKSAHVTSTNRKKFQKSEILIRSLFFIITGSLFPSFSFVYSNHASSFIQDGCVTKLYSMLIFHFISIEDSSIFSTHDHDEKQRPSTARPGGERQKRTTWRPFSARLSP